MIKRYNEFSEIKGLFQFSFNTTQSVFAVRFCCFLLLSLLLFETNQTYSQTLITVGTGTGVPSVGTNPTTTAEACSPYGVNVGSGSGGKKVQMIYTAAMINTAMTNAGYTPGASFISTVGFNITGIVTA